VQSTDNVWDVKDFPGNPRDDDVKAVIRTQRDEGVGLFDLRLFEDRSVHGVAGYECTGERNW
jgi:hypothetical protein